MATETIQGLSELSHALKTLPVNIGRNVLRGSVSAAAAVIRDEAKTKAPTYTGPVSDGHPPPGTLKRSIIIKQIKEESSDMKQVFFVTVRHGKKYRGQGKKGDKSQDAFYWKWVEFGHYFIPPGKHGFGSRDKAVDAVKSGSSLVSGSQYIVAHPFMRPAFEAKKVDALRALAEYMAKRIPEEAYKLARKSITRITRSFL